MDFLQKQILDNSIQDYLIVISVIIFFRLFRRFLSKPFALGLYFVISGIWKHAEKKAFMEMIARPLGWFITILAGLTAISGLRYPSYWNLDLYGIPLQMILHKLMLMTVLLTISWFLSKLVNFSALVMEKKAQAASDAKNDQLIIFFRDLLKVIIAIATIFLILRFVFERDISSLLTGLSIVGAALALAAKETIENLIGSFIIFFDEPFSAGDQVKVNNINGTIEHIGLRSTRIRTLDKTLVTVPNKQMVDSQVDNWTKRTERRAEIRLELGIITPTAKLLSLEEKAKAALSVQPAIIRHSVFFSEISKGSKILVIEYFTEPCPMDEFNRIKAETNLSVSKAIEELEITLTAGAQVTIISDAGNPSAGSQSLI